MTGQAVPFGELFVQLLLAVGAALFGANLFIVLRHRFARDQSRLPPRPPMRRLALNMVIGAAVAIWALATLLTAR